MVPSLEQIFLPVSTRHIAFVNRDFWSFYASHVVHLSFVNGRKKGLSDEESRAIGSSIVKSFI